MGTLKLTGYLRGQVLSVNSLVHIPGWGDFQMQQIDSAPDPYSLGNTKQELQEYKILDTADKAKQVWLLSYVLDSEGGRSNTDYL